MAVTPNSIVTAQAIRTATAVCTAAKTTYNDTANAVALLGAQSNGCVIYSLKAMPRAQNAAAIQLQLYRSPDAGVTLYLINTVTMAVSNVTTTTGSVTPTDFGYSESNPLRLGNTDLLYVAIASALAGGVVFDAQLEAL